MNAKSVGHKTWAIPEGYIPAWSHGPQPEMVSHEALCILNTTDSDAHVEVTIYYADRDPVGPYKLLVPARRVQHFRFNALDQPEKIPHGTTYASLIESDVPVVVQYTRLDSRQAENALLSTVAFGVD